MCDALLVFEPAYHIINPPAGTGRGMSRSDRGMGWRFAGRNGKVAKTLPLNHVTIFWSFAPKTKPIFVIGLPCSVVLWTRRRGVKNTCDTLYQLIWSKCRRHFAPNRHRSLADLTSALREAHLSALRNRERCGQPRCALLSV